MELAGFFEVFQWFLLSLVGVAFGLCLLSLYFECRYQLKKRLVS